MRKKDIANGQMIYKYIRRRMHWFFLLILILSSVFILAAAYIDCNLDRKKALYYYIAQSLDFFGDNWYEWGRDIKHAISENIEKFYDTLTTVNTILAATVVFFYSVQDNKKEGIPHRAILACSFGSFTIPIFFIFAMLNLTVGFWLFHFGMRVTFIVCILLSYIFQMMIIILILCSTSYLIGLYVICNAEIRQYTKLCKIKDNDEVNQENDPQFIWTYLMHYLEQVVMSDELIADKMMHVRRLLETPYYKKGLSIFKKLISGKKYVSNMSITLLENNNLKRIYEFYYGNLLAVMEYLNKTDNATERNKIYLVLYEFLNNMQMLYQKTCELSDETFEAERNYMMTIAGIMNAVLESDAEDAEGFCNYILNKCIEDKAIREKQIGLYFLFQEYLYRTHIDENKDNRVRLMTGLEWIHGIAKWSVKPGDEELYFDFWKIWMVWTTTSDKLKGIYFKDAMSTLKGENYHSCPMGYIMLMIKRAGLKRYENKDNSID